MLVSIIKLVTILHLIRINTTEIDYFINKIWKDIVGNTYF